MGPLVFRDSREPPCAKLLKEQQKREERDEKAKF